MAFPAKSDIEVTLRTDGTRAVIEGKTTVPFKTFVMLILQRKVMALFKEWGNAPIVVSSELLTSLASAPGDTQENRTHLVLVTLGVGILGGIFLGAVGQLFLEWLGFTVGRRELAIIAAGLLSIAALAGILSRVHVRGKGQKIADAMEHMADLLSRK